MSAFVDFATIQAADSFEVIRISPRKAILKERRLLGNRALLDVDGDDSTIPGRELVDSSANHEDPEGEFLPNPER